MFTKNATVEYIMQFVAACNLQNIVFDKVILFGSYATGDATEESDIDLLLVSKQFGYDKWDNARLLARILKNFYPIEAHTYPLDSYLAGDPFIKEVTAKGLDIK